jgi:decaprenyl-phosphate phosphoribosyltransferase
MWCHNPITQPVPAPPAGQASSDLAEQASVPPAGQRSSPPAGQASSNSAARQPIVAREPVPAPARSRPRLGVLVRACRPRQWVKNVLVVAAPGAAGVLTRPEVGERVLLAFVCFCMLASAGYMLNDVHDRDEDRLSTSARKRRRPIAAGELSVRAAVAAGLLLAVAGLALAAVVHPALAAVGAGYLALTAAYTLWWRSVAVADIAAVAGCFVLRALAGGAATAVPVSRWFMLVTSFGALFIVAGKRYAELIDGGHSEPARASLRDYSAQYLRFVSGLAAAVATTGYCLWAFQRAHSAKISWYEITVIPFVLWLLRYALLLDRGEGQAPEELVLRDRFLLTMSAAWVAVFVCGVYLAG